MSKKELIDEIKKMKFQILVSNKDEIIKMRKSTLCDRLIKLLEEIYE